MTELLMVASYVLAWGVGWCSKRHSCTSHTRRNTQNTPARPVAPKMIEARG